MLVIAYDGERGPMRDTATRLLVLEDSPEDLELIRHALANSHGARFKISAVARLDDALSLLARRPFDAILCDLGLPDSGGFDTFLRLRQACGDVPVVILTGVEDESLGLTAMQSGAQDYLYKGAIEGQSLARTIRYAMERHSLELSLRHANERLEERVHERTAVVREREAGLHRAQLMARLAHVVTGPQGDFESWSETLPQLLGVDAARMPRSTREWLEYLHAEDRPLFRAASIDAGRRGARMDISYRLKRADGEWVHIKQVMEPIQGAVDAGGAMRWFNTLQDVTEQKSTEDRIRRLNRVHAMLSGINALIVRVQSRDELFREAIRVAVEAGGFPFAWLGMVDEKATQVVPVAWQGAGEDYIRSMPLGLGTAGRGLAGKAVAERTAVVSEDMARDPRVRLQSEADMRNFHSLAILPLIVGEQAVGVLALYASEIGFFDADEMKLLRELAGDIAFSLDHIDKSSKLDYLAYYDALTGLANRTLLHERLAQFVSVASHGEHKLALVLLDIERFKTINDSLGRHAGDALLKQMAERLLATVGDKNQLARIGADHFAIVLPKVKQEQDLPRAIEENRRRILEQPFQVGGTELRVSTKAGIALFPRDGADPDTLFRNAEAALKRAKASGEPHLFYTQQMTERSGERLTLENKLRQALEKGEFVLHYQSKVDSTNAAILGVEALIRWNSAELGLVPPMKFIPLMEETGLIMEVGAWALSRAVQDHARWLRQGLAAPRIAVNVSPIQLRKRDFVSAVVHALKQGAAPPGIDLEITESLIMEDIQGNIGKLKLLRDLGVGIAIDDFGTGYSSLGYLAKLPVQTLKIDRSFIITMLDDRDIMSLVSTIISLAHSLRLRVVAEGVDSEEQAKFLRLLRCDEMQGFLFSRPLPIEEFTLLLPKAA